MLYLPAFVLSIQFPSYQLSNWSCWGCHDHNVPDQIRNRSGFVLEVMELFSGILQNLYLHLVLLTPSHVDCWPPTFYDAPTMLRF